MPDESMNIMLNSGTTSFGLFTDRNILFFLFKIAGFLDWLDLAFAIHLVAYDKLNEAECYLLFHLLLIESETSIIKRMRIVSVSPTFRYVLSEIIRQQNKEKFDTISYYKDIGSSHP